MFLNELGDLFTSNTVITIDTEYTIELNIYKRRVAYMQFYGIQTNTVHIFSYLDGFSEVVTQFANWLMDDVICIGFHILTLFSAVYLVTNAYSTSNKYFRI